MRVLVLDFETHYTVDYTLKKMTTEGYVRDPRFRPHLLGIYNPHNGFKQWVPEHLIGPVLKGIDWNETAVLAHHAHFDGLILAHHYGVVPCLWFDTLSMARLVCGNHVRVGLDSLAKLFELGSKTIDYGFRGKERLDETELAALGAGCLVDCELTWQLFQKLIELGVPQEELGVIDCTIRMFTEPHLVAQPDALHKLVEVEQREKFLLMNELNVTEKDLASTAKFAALLEAEGIEVERKTGKTGPIPAVAATDQFMRELLDSGDPRVATLARARLEVSSSIDETRAARLAGMAERGALPVYLQYCGAQTLRWSGGDKVNFQNMRRGSELRSAIEAPEGWLLAIVDLSQIEARLAAWIGRQEDLLERFRRKEDPYLPLASQFYGEEVDKKDAARRGIGKLGILSCGYGSGGATIVKTAAKGTYGPPVALTQEEGIRFRDAFRAANPGIVKAWKELDWVLRCLGNPEEKPFELRPGVTVGPGRITMPNGCPMLYELEWGKFGEAAWFRRTRSGWRRIWGGVLLQNLCEAYGRLLVSQAMLRLRQVHNIRTVLLAHDEIVCLIKDSGSSVGDNKQLEVVMDEMTVVPWWLDGCPIAAEGAASRRYTKP